MTYDYAERTANRLFPTTPLARPAFPAPTASRANSGMSPFSKAALEFQGKVGMHHFGDAIKNEFNANGIQRYIATRTSSDPDPKAASNGANQSKPYFWKFVEPIATLFDDKGELVGDHYLNDNPKGAAWQGTDRSKVVAQIDKDQVASTLKGAIPWLILTAQDAGRGGSGVFADVTHIERVLTVGGTAPPDSIIKADDVARGRYVDIPYQARYRFFSKPKP